MNKIKDIDPLPDLEGQLIITRYPVNPETAQEITATLGELTEAGTRHITNRSVSLCSKDESTRYDILTYAEADFDRRTGFYVPDSLTSEMAANTYIARLAIARRFHDVDGVEYGRSYWYAVEKDSETGLPHIKQELVCGDTSMGYRSLSEVEAESILKEIRALVPPQ